MKCIKCNYKGFIDSYCPQCGINIYGKEYIELAKSLESKKKWHKSKGKLHWWKEEPYREIDVLKYKDGWWVFYNNLTIHKKPFDTKIRALQSAKKFMKRR